MRIRIAIALITVCLLACHKPINDQIVVPVNEPVASDNLTNPSLRNVVEALSLNVLVGKWFLLDSEGEQAASEDYLIIDEVDGKYDGTLVYQGSMKKITVKYDGKDYLVFSDGGEKYRLYRVRSRFLKENNSIGLDLIIGNGLDDIDLGSFQREDILKKLEGQ
ncbi:MAG TPA: hypothetical protein VMX33_06585 [bacterium]|nr:hypothetical protein [bacterium]